MTNNVFNTKLLVCRIVVLACVRIGRLDHSYPSGFFRRSHLIAFVGALFLAYSPFPLAAQAPIPVLTASPDPIIVAPGQVVGQTTLTWNAPGYSSLEVHVSTPTGPLFATSGASGSADTGVWVRDGMQFFLVDATSGNVLTAFTATVESGWIVAGPNPIITNDPSQIYGSTLIHWYAPGYSSVDVHVGSEDGPLFASGGSEGYANTGNWVSDGTVFYLIDSATGNLIATTMVSVNPDSAFGVASVAYIDEGRLSTYSSTYMDYSLSAVYDAEVDDCVYQNNAAVACGSAISTGGTTADHVLNIAIQSGTLYTLYSSQIVHLSQIIVDNSYYYYNPAPFGYDDFAESDNVEEAGYSPDPYADIYVLTENIELGRMSVDIVTPMTAFNNGDFTDVVDSMTANGDGSYTAELTGAGLGTGLDYGFIGIDDVAEFPPCQFPSPACLVVNGVESLAKVIVAGAVIWELWHKVHYYKEASPVGWPGNVGNDPTLPDGWDVAVDGQGEPNGNYIKHNPDGSTETLHPEVDPPGRGGKHGPHWDYTIQGGGQKARSGRIYPHQDGPGGWIEWNGK